MYVNRFSDDGRMFIFFQTRDDIYGCGVCNNGIPTKEFISIKQRMEMGMDYVTASPRYEISRMDAAVILSTPWSEIPRNK